MPDENTPRYTSGSQAAVISSNDGVSNINMVAPESTVQTKLRTRKFDAVHIVRETVDYQNMSRKAYRAYEYEQVAEFEREIFFNAKQIKTRHCNAETYPHFCGHFLLEKQPEQRHKNHVKRRYERAFARIRAL